MKNLRSFSAAILLTFLLSFSAFAGEMGTPGIAGDIQTPSAAGDIPGPGMTGEMGLPGVAGQMEFPVTVALDILRGALSLF